MNMHDEWHGRSLTGERFLVCGSDGCIGSWAVANLALAGAGVVAADVWTEGRRVRRLLDEEAVARVAFETCDITVPGAVDRIVADHGITRIVHLAALQVPFVAADPVRGVAVNVLGTAHVLEAARNADSVAGVSYASSTAALGSADSASPDTLYGALKVCNEETARFYGRDYGTPAVGLRPCVVYGPNRDQGLTAAVTHAMRAVVLGRRYTIPFGGPLDLQYAPDVAWAFVQAALAEPQESCVFDLRGDLIAVEEVVELLADEVPEAAGLVDCAAVPVPGRVDLDGSGLRDLVGELPSTPIRDGIRATIEAFRRLHRDGRLAELHPA